MPSPTPPTSPAETPQTRWYYSEETNQVVGPFSFRDLEKMSDAGMIKATTYVFEEGGSEWLPFSKIKAHQNNRGLASLPKPQATSSKSSPLRKAITTKVRESYFRLCALPLWLKLFLPILLLSFLVAVFVREKTEAVPHGAKATQIKVGEHLQVKSGSWLFADEGAFRDFQKTQNEKNDELLSLLEKNERIAHFQIQRAEVWVSATKGFQGYVQVRVFWNGLRRMLWTSPDNLKSWPTPKSFTVGTSVEIAENEALYSDADSIRAYRKAEAENDEEKTKQLWEQLHSQTRRLKRPVKATIVTVGKDDYYETERAKVDGSLIRSWVYGGSLTPYLTPAERATTGKVGDLSRTLAQPKGSLASDGQGGRTRHISDFIQVFDGGRENAAGEIVVSVNDAGIGNLADMIEAIYDGTITPQLASKYAFRQDAVEGVFANVVGNYLIFKVTIPNYQLNGRELEFAMQRDPDFEKRKVSQYGTLDAFYEDLQGADFSSDSPLAEGSIVIVGMEQFTTGSGLVKTIPVVKTVSLVP